MFTFTCPGSGFRCMILRAGSFIVVQFGMYFHAERPESDGRLWRDRGGWRLPGIFSAYKFSMAAVVMGADRIAAGDGHAHRVGGHVA